MTVMELNGAGVRGLTGRVVILFAELRVVCRRIGMISVIVGLPDISLIMSAAVGQQ
jgi:hypothetical protein